MSQTKQNQLWLSLLDRYGALEVAKKIEQLPSYESYRRRYPLPNFRRMQKLEGRV